MVMENLRNSNNKSSNRKWKFSKFAPILAGALLLMNPSWAEAQNAPNQTKTKVEISTSTILDRLNQNVWVSLPSEYNGKVLDFVLNDTIMRTRSATAYTEDFIINEMKKDWWINKENQLLFVWSKIYGWISQKKLYNRLDDENESRSAEYKKSLKQIATCYEEYKKWFKTYMEMWISEADRRISEADRRISEADRRIFEADRRIFEADRRISEADSNAIESLNNALTAIIDFYNSYNISPDPKRLESFKPKVEKAISLCKQYNIDYKAKLSKEILKFYGIE